MTISAIETWYAGCRFRSRLEARWAVLFDSLGIRWEYEPQGYMVGDVGPRPYLPDFWLPGARVWVEVKGSRGALDRKLILDACIPHWGLPPAPMLILGPVPEPQTCYIGHSVLKFHKGDVYRYWAYFAPGIGLTWQEGMRGAGDSDWLGCDSGDCGEPYPDLTTSVRLRGLSTQSVQLAYQTARSARFEHGQVGGR